MFRRPLKPSKQPHQPQWWEKLKEEGRLYLKTANIHPSEQKPEQKTQKQTPKKTSRKPPQPQRRLAIPIITNQIVVRSSGERKKERKEQNEERKEQTQQRPKRIHKQAKKFADEYSVYYDPVSERQQLKTAESLETQALIPDDYDQFRDDLQRMQTPDDFFNGIFARAQGLTNCIREVIRNTGNQMTGPNAGSAKYEQIVKEAFQGAAPLIWKLPKHQHRITTCSLCDATHNCSFRIDHMGGTRCLAGNHCAPVAVAVVNFVSKLRYLREETTVRSMTQRDFKELDQLHTCIREAEQNK